MNKIKKAILLANFSAIILVIIKFITGIITGSLAVLSSALDSGLDFLVSLFNLHILKKSDTKNCDTYNYGQGKIQGFGALFEGFIVLFSGGILIYASIQKIFELYKKGTYEIEINSSIYIMIISIFITGSLVYYLDKIAKETNNLTLKADSLHYKTDLYSNSGIILSLIIIKYTGYTIMDSIISILIGIYIIFSSKNIIIEGYYMLMDKKISDEEINKILKIINNTDKRVTGYHFLKTRKSGNDTFIDFHLVFDKYISLLDAHNIAEIVEKEIKYQIPFSNILIHLDPYDDS